MQYDQFHWVQIQCGISVWWNVNPIYEIRAGSSVWRIVIVFNFIWKAVLFGKPDQFCFVCFIFALACAKSRQSPCWAALKQAKWNHTAYQAIWRWNVPTKWHLFPDHCNQTMAKIQNHSPSKHPIIIIMSIYHALINALSAHMIQINPNMIFYTHVKHSPTKTIYIKYY